MKELSKAEDSIRESVREKKENCSRPEFSRKREREIDI